MSQDQSRRPATVLESVEDLRAEIRRGQTLPMETPSPFRPPTADPRPKASQAPPSPQAPATPADDGTLAFSPTHRPSMALLVILDDFDDDKEGETRRLRGSTCVIGRSEGDVVIPHDTAISGRHAEISRRTGDGQSQWFLKDLGSSNGTFARISKSPMQPGQELYLGSRRYRFESQKPIAEDSQDTAPTVASTRKMQALRPDDLETRPSPTLVALDDPEGERRFRLVEPEYWIGRDSRQCSIAVDDPMLSPRHARLHRDAQGRWNVENARSLNGLWFRITEIPIGRNCQFLCGEQRFLIKVLVD